MTFSTVGKTKDVAEIILALLIFLYFFVIVFNFYSNGQNCMSTLNVGYNPNALYPERNIKPGQYFDIDQQCANMAGAGSMMCRVCVLHCANCA